MARPVSVGKLHPAYNGRSAERPAFQAAYLEDLCGIDRFGNLVEQWEVGLDRDQSLHPGPSVTIQTFGSIFYAVRLSARYWSLFLHRPAVRAAHGLPLWPVAWVPPSSHSQEVRRAT
ncbi:MAG: hypothetical protein AAGJ10_11970 [Bacteroidota bacterium]